MLRNELTVVEGVALAADLRSEVKQLQNLLSQVKEYRDKYDPATLTKDIRILQAASRVQGMRPDVRDLYLLELQRRKTIKDLIEPELV